jgi:hypothetical protein
MSVREPRGAHLRAGAEVQDLAVFAALDVYQPRLPARRVEVVAEVQDRIPRRPEQRAVEVAPLGLRQHAPLAGTEVVAVEPGRFDLFAGLRVEVGPVNEPTPVRMHLPAPNVIVWRLLRERLHYPRFLQIYPEQPFPLVTVAVLPDHDRAAIRRPRDHPGVVGRLRQAQRGRRAVRPGDEHVGAGPRFDQLHATHRPSGETSGPRKTGAESKASRCRSDPDPRLPTAPGPVGILSVKGSESAEGRPFSSTPDPRKKCSLLLPRKKSVPKGNPRTTRAKK